MKRKRRTIPRIFITLLGIGLIFIREVLIKHGCTFSLRTYPDKLTRFRIRF